MSTHRFTLDCQGGASDDVRIAEYVCGLLGPNELTDVHRLLGENDEALQLALAWEHRLLALVDALPREHPDPALRLKLQHTLGIGAPPADLTPPRPQLLRKPSVNDPSESAAIQTATANAFGHHAVHSVGQNTRKPDSDVTRAHVSPASTAASDAATPTALSASTASSGSTASPDPTVAAAPTVPTSPASSHRGTTAHTSARPANPSGAHAIKTSSASPEDAPGGGTSGPATRRDGTSAASAASASSAQHAHAQRRLVRQVWLWRLVSMCAVAAAVAGFMLPGEPPPPPVQVIKVAPTRAAILQAPGTTSTPGWTATLDPHGNLVMRPHVHTEVPADRQVVLWTRSPSIPEPRLLARIDPNRPVQIPAAQLGTLADDQLLEITLERQDDAARGIANGPILFIGQMTVFGSETALPETTGAASAAGGPITQPARP